MATLTLYNDYSRREVHDIFGTDEPFTTGAGTWGIHGIINIRRRPGDYILYVSFGQEIAGEPFVESITQDGVLSWQSQPTQTLGEERIQRFIAHDELTNSIYLFLRTRSHTGLPYTYLGRLKYLSHDNQSERPVRIKWQILDWHIDRATLQHMALGLRDESGQILDAGSPGQYRLGLTSNNISADHIPVALQGSLIETDPPVPNLLDGLQPSIFNGNIPADYSGREENNRELGRAGEQLVVRNEKSVLSEQGHEDLAVRVKNVAQDEGDGAGYDVLSFTSEGQEKYIEVKTTRGSASSSFFITINEVRTSERLGHDFYLYRVYEYHDATNSGKFYVLTGDMNQALNLVPRNYRATLSG